MVYYTSYPGLKRWLVECNCVHKGKESINQKIAPNMMVTSAWNVTDYAWKREI